MLVVCATLPSTFDTSATPPASHTKFWNILQTQQLHPVQHESNKAKDTHLDVISRFAIHLHICACDETKKIRVCCLFMAMLHLLRIASPAAVYRLRSSLGEISGIDLLCFLFFCSSSCRIFCPCCLTCDVCLAGSGWFFFYRAIASSWDGGGGDLPVSTTSAAAGAFSLSCEQIFIILCVNLKP
jgi:hypothetical protein